MNFRDVTDWTTANTPNLQRDSYDCGYGAGRTDLPVVGYNPVYPSMGSGFSSNTYGTPSTSYLGTQTNPNVTYTSPYASQQYNPESSGYNHREPTTYNQQGYQSEGVSAPTSIVTVDISRYTHKNSVRHYGKNFAPSTKELFTIPQAPTPPNFGENQQQASATSGRFENEIVVVEDSPSNTTQDSIVVNTSHSDKGSNSPSKMSYPAKQTQNGKVSKKYQETIYGRKWNSGGYPGYEYGYGDGPWMNAVPPPQSFGRGPFGRPGAKQFGKAPARPQNSKDDIPFVPIPEGMESLTLKIDPGNLECFSGPSSIFTTQHVGPVLIDNHIYESVDHYYQYRKVVDLCGNASENITNCIRNRVGNRKDNKTEFNDKRHVFSHVARGQLKLNRVSRDIIEEWRRTKGLKAVQEGLLAKLSQDPEFRHALTVTREKILVHAFVVDTIYGTGSEAPQVKKWCSDMVKGGNTKLVIPATFPLNEETVKHCPTFSHGRNVLGVILMQLREMLANNNVNIVDMKSLFTAIKEGKDPQLSVLEDLSITGNSFSIGGGDMQSGTGME